MEEKNNQKELLISREREWMRREIQKRREGSDRDEISKKYRKVEKFLRKDDN